MYIDCWPLLHFSDNIRPLQPFLVIAPLIPLSTLKSSCNYYCCTDCSLAYGQLVDSLYSSALWNIFTDPAV